MNNTHYTSGSAIFGAGYVAQKGNWKSDLANKANVELCSINWDSVDQSIRESLESDVSFRGRNGKMASEESSAYRLLSTGLKERISTETIFAKFNRGKPGGHFKWMGVEFLTEKEFMSEIIPPLYQFAYFPNPNWTTQLAQKAAKELWTLKSSPRDYDVLFKYLTYTYEKLEEDGQIAESIDCAAFHTGLYSPTYEPIFAYFTPHQKPGQQKWRFVGFYSPNEVVRWKEMSRRLNLSIAKPANWFKDPVRLFCNPDLLDQGSLAINFDHCVIDNASRLPTRLVRQSTQDSNVLSALEVTYDNDDSKRVAIAAAIRASGDYKNILANLTNHLRGAIDLARRKVLCDYTAAVPQFYPDHASDNDGFGFLLPLSFDWEEPDAVQCALVVQPTKDNRGYFAETIITSDMAYSNARLLRRPNAHWLTERLKSNS